MKHTIKRILASICFCSLLAVSGFSEEKLSDKLTVEGFLVAFFVGLLVNQVTDFIGYFKGTIQVADIWPTIMISIVLLIVCTGFFIFMFLSEILKLFKEV